ncbi:DoxX family protein [Autumnicola musiva]|uniref:DoxX family protein n=1 Tax=Autumnicola musiva TaxID=3075589 RepID=A0ABU3D6W1_9FLAO|nr:DoxX family protein [Zunongwangia sp. F117]MDT0677276.1 DoxX family protein [Zunongwangia sp. F117]
MKHLKIIFWITTGLIFLFQGVMPALTGHTEMAKEGIRHLGYPEYFGITLTIFKVLGALVLIIPKVPKRLKEWAYAGFTFDFIFAAISIWAVDGPGLEIFFPFIVLAIHMTSYFSYHKLIRNPININYETQAV